MTRFKLPAALALLSVLSPAQTPARGSEGRELPAPPWSFACMTDHGPSDCGEPMWIYGAPGQQDRSEWRSSIRDSLQLLGRHTLNDRPRNRPKLANKRSAATARYRSHTRHHV